MPKLYIHVNEATHFLQWELEEFRKYFEIVDKPGDDTIVMVFGPDVLDEASRLPALMRYATLFPGFGQNPLYNKKLKQLQHKIIREKYDGIFINPGPLELAYAGLPNVHLYPFSVDVDSVKFKRPRKKVKSILHVSSDYPQKDWKRSEAIMKKTGLKWEIFPPRDKNFFLRANKKKKTINVFRKLIGLQPLKIMPHGYTDHSEVIRKYQSYDSFIHVAKDIKDEIYIDGKYTATLIEAGLTGAILFWHDTFGLGNNLKTVFDLPLDPDQAALRIKEIIDTIDVEEHSLKTHNEMRETFNPQKSVSERAFVIQQEHDERYGT